MNPGPEMLELTQFVDQLLPAIEDEMRAVVGSHDPDSGDLVGLLRYHLGWVDAAFEPRDGRSGKRLRPLLCLLACEGCGGRWEEALPAAAAIELLHNFSLIHDDIEDQDTVRRGRPTVWSVWGEAQGINAGDTLFSVAQLALLGLAERDVPTERILEAARLFNETCVALTGGQHLDIGFESRDQVSVNDYLTMIEGKTAALVACSCEMGALVAGAETPQRTSLREFGRHAGLAFQMQDDVLGIWGEPDVTGKPAGADIARRKKTLPLLHGMERSAALRSLLAKDTQSDADVREATTLLEEAGSREYTVRLAREHYDRALSALDDASLAPRPARALRQLAEKLLDRKH